MMEKLELISDDDIERLNNLTGPYGITAAHDLLGAPVIYIDHEVLDRYHTEQGNRKIRLTEKQIKQVLMMHGKGYTYRQISDKAKVSLGSINRIVHETKNHG